MDRRVATAAVVSFFLIFFGWISGSANVRESVAREGKFQMVIGPLFEPPPHLGNEQLIY